MSELLDDDTPVMVVKCQILPTLNEIKIKVPQDGTINELDTTITSELGIYPKHIIFRGEIMDDYTKKLSELDIRRNDVIFVVKRELSSTLLRSSSSQTTDLVQRLLNVGHSVVPEGGEVTVNFEITDGDDTVTSSETTSLTDSTTISGLLGETLSQLFGTNTIPSDVAPIPLPPLLPPPAEDPEVYRYQTELEQILGMGYVDEVAIRAALNLTSGDVSSSLIYL